MEKFKNDIVKIKFEHPTIECNITEEKEIKTINIKDIDFKNVYVVNFKSK